MRIILDTNVFVSGIFFTGPPHHIVRAWREGRTTLVISPEIYEEYRAVGLRLAADFPGVKLAPFLELLLQTAVMALAPRLSDVPCDDPDDVKFVACALVSATSLVVSGDRHLLRISGYRGLTVLTPRSFMERYLLRRELP